jgi:hypothetical protein
MSYFFFVVFFAFFAGAFLVAIIIFTPFHRKLIRYFIAYKAGMPDRMNSLKK